MPEFRRCAVKVRADNFTHDNIELSDFAALTDNSGVDDFKVEGSRITSAFRYDVSRAGESGLQFRGHFFCRRSHHRDFLPTNLLGEKAGTTERGFLFDPE